MGYVYQVFVADEQPTPSKWQQLWSNDAAMNDGSGLSAISSPIKAASANHLIFTAASGSSVKIGVLRQNQSSNVYEATSLIQSGFTAIVGDGTAQIEKTITFPIAYDAAPIIVTEYVSAKVPGTEANSTFINQFVGQSNDPHVASSSDVTATTALITLSRVVNTLNAANTYAVSWIAIGKKA